ncbi:DNA repair protein SWI5 homolog [Lucilia sericata]|uniref:DNA repair protein SWI5 homolog n=1 Tax=Lucilia sericata TaxID=13632 RepID=UPI0018A80A0F|nr:DNA repair protein SWI5 homolog [Lucilia sericata]
MPLVTPDISPSLHELIDFYKDLQKQLEDCPDSVAPAERKQEIMNLLHEFNDVKDAAQIVIGKLANMQGKTIKELHLEYNLPLNE